MRLSRKLSVVAAVFLAAVAGTATAVVSARLEIAEGGPFASHILADFFTDDLRHVGLLAFGIGVIASIAAVSIFLYFSGLTRAVARLRVALLDRQQREQEAIFRREADDARRRMRALKGAQEQERLTETVLILGNALHQLVVFDEPGDRGLDQLRLEFGARLLKLAPAVSDQPAGDIESQAMAADASTAIRAIMDAVHLSSQRARTVSKLGAESDTGLDRPGNLTARTGEASSRILKIAKVIDDIAFQSKLLSLNAGIEAARAGEATEDFADAQHVRCLAQRATAAAKDVAALLTGLGEEINGGVGPADQIALSPQPQSVSPGGTGRPGGQMEQATRRGARAGDQVRSGSWGHSSDSRSLADLVSQFTTDPESEILVHRSPMQGEQPNLREFYPGPVVMPEARAPRVAEASPTAPPVSSPARALLGTLSSRLQSGADDAKSPDPQKDNSDEL